MQKLNEIADITDIFKHTLQSHPFTFGYNGDNLKHYDQVLTAKEDVGAFQTLDYIFEMKFKRSQINESTKLLAKSNKISVKDETIQITDVKISENRRSFKTTGDDFNKNFSKLSPKVLTTTQSQVNNIELENGKSSSRNLSIASSSTNKRPKLVVDYSSPQVEYFLISEKPYQQLSDHFGLSVDVKLESH